MSIFRLCMHSLMEKGEGADYSEEIAELEAALARQQENRATLDARITADVAQLTEHISTVTAE